MDYNTQDRIDAYIRGEMNASDRASFSRDLSQDNELRKDYEFTRNVANSISDRERKKRQIREWNTNGVKTIYMYSTIASIAAMLVVGFFMFRNMPSDNVIILSNESSSISSEKYYAFAEIGQLIENQDYDVALKYIEEIESTDHKTSLDSVSSANTVSVSERVYELKWFKAQALLGLKRVEEARTILKDISSSCSRYKEKADSLWMELQFDNDYIQ
jgi:hypothetical protein